MSFAIAIWIAVALALGVLTLTVVSVARIRVVRELLWALVPVAIIAAAATPAIQQSIDNGYIVHRQQEQPIVAQADIPRVTHEVEARSR